jgi:hypothetical protein
MSYGTHLICWLVPMALTLLPLINTSYGVDGAPYGWCWLKPHRNNPWWMMTVWYWATYYIWMWPLLIGSFIILGFVQWRKSYTDLSDTGKRVSEIIRKLYLYPLVMTFCWAFTTVIDSTVSYLAPNQYYSIPGIETMDYFADVLPCCQGFLFSVVFWFTMDVLRNRLYCRVMGQKIHPISPSKAMLRSSVVPRRVNVFRGSFGSNVAVASMA